MASARVALAKTISGHELYVVFGGDYYDFPELVVADSYDLEHAVREVIERVISAEAERAKLIGGVDIAPDTNGKEG